jgi:[ribosomal protein S5]-alanine N-acetyltransferase
MNEAKDLRIRLRPLEPADAAATAVLITPGVSRWTGSWPESVTAAEVLERIRLTAAAALKGLAFTRVIERANDGALMGWISAKKATAEETVGTLGYWIGECFHGQGYMTEAVRTFLPLAWDALALKVIEAGAQPDNAASIAILKRLGMRPIGERTELAPARGRFEKCVWFALLRFPGGPLHIKSAAVQNSPP